MTEHADSLFVVRHNGWHLVAGLRWQLMNGRRKAAAKRVAVSQNADWFAMAAAGKAQLLVGSGQLSEAGISPHKSGYAASLALHVLPLLGENGWGIFALEAGKYWFIASQNGMLSVLSDVAGDDGTVRHALETFLSFSSSQAGEGAVFCPQGFLAETVGIPRTLETLLQHSGIGRMSRLHPVASRLPLICWTALLLAVVGGYGGVHYYQASQQAKRIAAARAVLAGEQNPATPPSPWQTEPVLKDFLTHCSRQWKTVPLSIAGWHFSHADCTQQHIIVYWRRVAGKTLSEFTQRLAHWYPGLAPQFNLAEGADTASVTLPLQMPLAAVAENITDADSQRTRLINYAQQIRADLQLSEAREEEEKGSAWGYFSFVFSTGISPDYLFSAAQFDAAGIRLSQITVSLNQAKLYYILKGTLYVQR